jgi:hypothetical protein
LPLLPNGSRRATANVASSTVASEIDTARNSKINRAAGANPDVSGSSASIDTRAILIAGHRDESAPAANARRNSYNSLETATSGSSKQSASAVGPVSSCYATGIDRARNNAGEPVPYGEQLETEASANVIGRNRATTAAGNLGWRSTHYVGNSNGRSGRSSATAARRTNGSK